MAKHQKRLGNRLTDLALPRKPGKYPDGLGLWFVVSLSGSRRWEFRFKIDGRERYMGLGSYPDVSVADARDKAGKARQDKARGDDPIIARDRRDAEKRAQAVIEAAKLVTFRQCAEAYIKAKRAAWSNAKHAKQWETTLAQYAYPIIGDLPVGAVDTPLVLQILEPHWTTKAETMSRLQGRLASILSWARARGHRSGDNPAAWSGHLKELLPSRPKVQRVQHLPAMPYTEVPAFIARLGKMDSVPARCLEFTILPDLSGSASDV